ncbi:MAG: hypothetical protein K2P81_10390 [Bacteriovoracaceae bacterium]|nr:hypothetical protein [Bacteriovoracaceae bacterium]
MKIIASLFLLLGLSFQTLAITPQCEQKLEDINTRLATIQKMTQAINTLLGQGTGSDFPLTVLFKVDLSDVDNIQERIKELKLESQQENLLNNPQLKVEATCTQALLKRDELIRAQIEFNHKKVEFLSLTKERRSLLESSYKSLREKSSNTQALENELATSNETLKLAQEKLNESEESASKQTDTQLESLLTAQTLLEKFLVDVESENIQFLNVIKEKKTLIDQIQQEVTSLTQIKPSNDKIALSEQFQKCSDTWRRAVQSMQELFSDLTEGSTPQIPEKYVAEALNDPDGIYKKYDSLYLKAQKRLLKLAKSRSRILSLLKAQNFKVLSDAGKLRAYFLQECDRFNCPRPRGLSQRNLEGLSREIEVLPLRFISAGLSKWIEIKAKSKLGLDGWVNLAEQGVFLFLFLFIPFLLKKGFDFISLRLDVLRETILAKSMIDYRSRTNLAIWITRLNPFLPYVGMIVSLELSIAIIKSTDLPEISFFVFYLETYFFYKLSRLLLTSLLEVTLGATNFKDENATKLRIENLAKKLSRIIFVEFLLLHITRDAVRRALAYNLFYSIVFYINIFLLFFESYRWKDEIIEAFKNRFPSIKEKLSFLISKPVALALLLPPLFIASITLDIIKITFTYLTRFDFFKRLLSEYIRKRLEKNKSSDETQATPPQEYLHLFDYYLPAKEDIFLQRNDGVTSIILNSIQAWKGGKGSDDLLLIVGNRGMGRTTIFDFIAHHEDHKSQVLASRISPKLIEIEQFYTWLSKLLAHKINSIADFQDFDRVTSKKIILLDDIQNMFLGMIGGFEVYKVFLEIVSLRTKNIFWCLSINSHSWAYLKGVLGSQQFYGKVLTLSPWKDFEIQNLIMNRHKKTQYSISFDESIRAYGSGEVVSSQVESQFFRLLWGQSRGNPRSALMYWVSALSHPKEKHIHVGIPSFVSSSLVASMSDQSLFVLASLARHDSLTQDELCTVTTLESTVIRKCLKEAQDKGLIWIDDFARARISSRAQYVIDYYLIGKNFLYE